MQCETLSLLPCGTRLKPFPNPKSGMVTGTPSTHVWLINTLFSAFEEYGNPIANMGTRSWPRQKTTYKGLCFSLSSQFGTIYDKFLHSVLIILQVNSGEWMLSSIYCRRYLTHERVFSAFNIQDKIYMLYACLFQFYQVTVVPFPQCWFGLRITWLWVPGAFPCS